MTIRLIMNPGSRSGRGQRLWQVWEAGLRRAGVAFERVVTTGPGDACRISREARDADVVVAVGGDGTINEVLDGLAQALAPRPRMGVLYSGTSPDFCRFHRIPIEPAAALACLLQGTARPIDLGRIAFVDAAGKPQVAHFGCSCNIGLGAAIACFANRWRRHLGDAAGTGLGAVRAMFRCPPVDLELEIENAPRPAVAATGDGRPGSAPMRAAERIVLPRVNNLSILKNPYLASGLRLNVDLAPDDGRLVLAAVHGKSAAGLCLLLPRFYSGGAAASPAVLLKPCTRVTVRAAVPTEVEFDGDPRGLLPIEVALLPQILDLICLAPES